MLFVVGSVVGVYSIVTDRAGMLSQALKFYCELLWHKWKIKSKSLIMFVRS